MKQQFPKATAETWPAYYRMIGMSEPVDTRIAHADQQMAPRPFGDPELFTKVEA